MAGGSQAWILSSGDGAKNVEVEFKDAAGNVALVSEELILDGLPPLGSLSIASGVAYTTNEDVTLDLSASDAVQATAVRLRDEGGTWGPWQKLPDAEDDIVEASLSWSLPAGDSAKTVEAQYRDLGGNLSEVASDTILLDTTAPITFDNAGLLWHGTPFVLLLSPSDEGSGMSGGSAASQYSWDGGVTWTTSTSLTFSGWKRGGGSGIYRLLVRSIDAAGNGETPREVTVMIDCEAPTSSSDAPTTPQSGSVVVHLKGTDAYSGVAAIVYSLDGGPWTQVPYPGGAGYAITISGAGDHTVRYNAVDAAGNPQVGYNVCLVRIVGGGASKWMRVLPSRW